MTRSDCLARFVKGVQMDLDGYRQLRALLDEQFQAALRHQAEPLRDIARRIEALVDAMEARRRERVALVGHLCGAANSGAIQQVFAMLPERTRVKVQAWWDALDGLVRECKTLNARNGRLLMEQYEIMRRLMGEESDIYAPD
ncbi:MAG: flagellar protein FlgN [Gammaproteobacteria bacterium]